MHTSIQLRSRNIILYSKLCVTEQHSQTFYLFKKSPYLRDKVTVRGLSIHILKMQWTKFLDSLSDSSCSVPTFFGWHSQNYYGKTVPSSLLRPFH